jgi:hypothetical protein
MYQRIKNGLFYPKQLAESYKKGIIGFLIFLIILASLPTLLYICVNGIFTYEDIRNVKRIFVEEEVLEYRIENHQFIGNNATVKNKYIILEEETLGIVFVNDTNDSISVNEKMVIVLEQDGVYLSMPLVAGATIKLADYNNLPNIDFSAANDFSNSDFWNVVFGYVDDVLKANWYFVYPGYVIAVVMQMTISILLGIGSTTLILLLFDRTPGVKFGEVFKNSTSAYLPFVITLILSYAFNIQFLQFIGNIISFIYAMIAHNIYRLIKYKEISNHE